MKWILNIITLSLLISTALLSGCIKEKSDQINQPQQTAAIDYDAIRNCHLSKNKFPSQITANIEGTWVWEKETCNFTGQSTTADKHVVVKFNDGGLYKVTEDGKTISEGTWNLEGTGDEYWRINCSELNKYLNGQVLLCDNEAIFYSSYLDGCDYYFTRR